mgnify:CR=1 FL=1
MKNIDYVKENKSIFNEAHRGASGYYYMNTIPSFDEAVRLEADAIELDIRKTLDGKIIVVHDEDYHGKLINDWNYDDLCQETMNSNEKFIMPLLIDVLNRYKGKILLDIEFKEIGYEEEVIDMVLSILDVNEFLVRSFHEVTLRKIKEYNKDIYCVLLLGTGEKHFGGMLYHFLELFPRRLIKVSKCDAVSPYYKLMFAFFVSRMHRKKLPVYAWTVNDEKTIKKCINKGVDGIIGNYPDRVKNIIEKN